MFEGLSSLFVSRVGQKDVDIRLSGHCIKEQHCVFYSQVNDSGEGEDGWGAILNLTPSFPDSFSSA